MSLVDHEKYLNPINRKGIFKSDRIHSERLTLEINSNKNGKMKPTEQEPQFGVCPKCGGDTEKTDGKWKCKNCGYEENIE